MTTHRLLVIATGAANVVRLPDLLSLLRAGLAQQESSEPLSVSLLLSRGAERLIRRETAELFADRLYAESETATHFKPGHMGLALEHDQVLVLPASAQTVAASAHGLAHRLAVEVILGHPRPVLFFPSMNRHMWGAPPTQRNVALLRADGHHVVEPHMTKGFETATRTIVRTPVCPCRRSSTSFASIEPPSAPSAHRGSPGHARLPRVLGVGRHGSGTSHPAGRNSLQNRSLPFHGRPPR